MQVVGAYDGLTLLEPIRRLPRATMFFDAELSGSDRIAAQILAGDPDRIFTTVLLADSGAARNARRQLGTADPNATVTLIRNEPERMAWEVETEAPGLLLVNDAYYPGWTATVDGEPSDILRANIAFRAILVPDGRHEVAMQYQPKSVRYGTVVSIISLIIVLSAAFLTLVMPKERPVGDGSTLRGTPDPG